MTVTLPSLLDLDQMLHSSPKVHLKFMTEVGETVDCARFEMKALCYPNSSLDVVIKVLYLRL